VIKDGIAGGEDTIVGKDKSGEIAPGHSMVLPTFLVDGFVRGVWKIERVRMGAKLLIQPFEPLADNVCQDLQEEGAHLLHWVADRPGTFDIEFAMYDGKSSGQNLWGSV
jgi:hypothetical protein